MPKDKDDKKGKKDKKDKKDITPKPVKKSENKDLMEKLLLISQDNAVECTRVYPTKFPSVTCWGISKDPESPIVKIGEKFDLNEEKQLELLNEQIIEKKYTNVACVMCKEDFVFNITKLIYYFFPDLSTDALAKEIIENELEVNWLKYAGFEVMYKYDKSVHTRQDGTLNSIMTRAPTKDYAQSTPNFLKKIMPELLESIGTSFPGKKDGLLEITKGKCESIKGESWDYHIVSGGPYALLAQVKNMPDGITTAHFESSAAKSGAPFNASGHDIHTATRGNYDDFVNEKQIKEILQDVLKIKDLKSLYHKAQEFIIHTASNPAGSRELDLFGLNAALDGQITCAFINGCTEEEGFKGKPYSEFKSYQHLKDKLTIGTSKSITDDPVLCCPNFPQLAIAVSLQIGENTKKMKTLLKEYPGEKKAYAMKIKSIMNLQDFLLFYFINSTRNIVTSIKKESSIPSVAVQSTKANLENLSIVKQTCFKLWDRELSEELKIADQVFNSLFTKNHLEEHFEENLQDVLRKINNPMQGLMKSILPSFKEFIDSLTPENKNTLRELITDYSNIHQPLCHHNKGPLREMIKIFIDDKIYRVKKARKEKAEQIAKELKELHNNIAIKDKELTAMIGQIDKQNKQLSELSKLIKLTCQEYFTSLKHDIKDLYPYYIDSIDSIDSIYSIYSMKEYLDIDEFKKLFSCLILRKQHSTSDELEELKELEELIEESINDFIVLACKNNGINVFINFQIIADRVKKIANDKYYEKQKEYYERELETQRKEADEIAAELVVELTAEKTRQIEELQLYLMQVETEKKEANEIAEQLENKNKALQSRIEEIKESENDSNSISSNVSESSDTIAKKLDILRELGSGSSGSTTDDVGDIDMREPNNESSVKSTDGYRTDYRNEGDSGIPNNIDDESFHDDHGFIRGPSIESIANSPQTDRHMNEDRHMDEHIPESAENINAKKLISNVEKFIEENENTNNLLLPALKESLKKFVKVKEKYFSNSEKYNERKKHLIDVYNLCLNAITMQSLSPSPSLSRTSSRTPSLKLDTLEDRQELDTNTTSPKLPKDFEPINNAETKAKRQKVNTNESKSLTPLKRKNSEEKAEEAREEAKKAEYDSGEEEENNAMEVNSHSEDEVVGGKSLKNHKASKKSKTKKRKTKRKTKQKKRKTSKKKKTKRKKKTGKKKKITKQKKLKNKKTKKKRKTIKKTLIKKLL